MQDSSLFAHLYEATLTASSTGAGAFKVGSVGRLLY